VNGAINILRKEYPWVKMFNKKLLSPVRIKLSKEVKRIEKSPLWMTVMGAVRIVHKKLIRIYIKTLPRGWNFLLNNQHIHI
jgi:hypothetical protein